MTFQLSLFEQGIGILKLKYKDKYSLLSHPRLINLAETGGPAEEDDPGYCLSRLVPGSYAVVSGW